MWVGLSIMPNSYIDIPADGTTTLFSIPFGFIDRSHVDVLVDGVSTAFSWNTNSSVSVTPAPANGLIVRIKRTTPNTPVVDFQDGENLTEADLDNVNLQSLYLSQESADGLSGTMQIGDDGKVDAQNRVIKNVSTPTEDAEAATKKYVDDNTGATHANAASASATAAAASETAAQAHATSAAGSASAAGGSATAASNSAGAAATSASAAAASATAAATPSSGDRVQLVRQDLSVSNTFVFSGFNASLYREYVLVFEAAQYSGPFEDAGVDIRVSNDNQSNWVDTALYTLNGAVATQMRLMSGGVGSTNGKLVGRIHIMDADTDRPKFFGRICSHTSASAIVWAEVQGDINLGSGQITDLNIFTDVGGSPTLPETLRGSGFITVEGIRK